jgi:branched-subunit amino acid aminotransferase/4-amino-4-deoxychorismate lyase
MVFEGTRTFEDVTPDLDLHCVRVNHSASATARLETTRREPQVALFFFAGRLPRSRTR